LSKDAATLVASVEAGRRGQGGIRGGDGQLVSETTVALVPAIAAVPDVSLSGSKATAASPARRSCHPVTVTVFVPVKGPAAGANRGDRGVGEGVVVRLRRRPGRSRPEHWARPGRRTRG